MSRNQQGQSLVETLTVVAVVALLVSMTGAYTLATLRSERQRSATYQVYVQMNLARAEAVARNRDCRFTIDTATRDVRVLDLVNPATPADDVQLASATLDSSVGFGRPDGVGAVTLQSLSGTLYGTTFKSDGSASAGSGAVGLMAGDAYRRMTVYVGGGVSIERWNGSAWVTGS